MDGYQYLVARNRLMQKLEDDLSRLGLLGPAEREAEAEFGIQAGERGPEGIGGAMPASNTRRWGTQVHLFRERTARP